MRSPHPVRPLLLAALAASAALVAPGCGPLRSAVAFVRGTEGATAVDAHVVYRLRPGCPTLLARTLHNGYTVMTPSTAPPGADTPAGDAAPLEQPGFDLTGVFEGPVHVGASVFQYYPPSETETWRGQGVQVMVEILAVGLTLEEGGRQQASICGALPPGEGEPSETVPRIPRT